MFVAERKNSQSVGRSKKKVPKELLVALKNTQKLPPPPYGRFPDTGYPAPTDPHLHELQRRAAFGGRELRPEEKGKVPQIKVNAPPSDDILEDDINKIAFEKKSRTLKEGQLEPPVKVEESKNQLPHIQEKEIQDTHNHLVQSVYYPEGTEPPTKKISKQKLEHQGTSRDLLVERLYHTDRKDAGGYTKDSCHDPYVRYHQDCR